MKNLQLSLKKKWFEMTKPLIKKEDYRAINAYWANRFFLYKGESKKVNWWKWFFEFEGCFYLRSINTLLEMGDLTFKKFDKNIMTLGYPKSGDTERILKLEHKGIEIREGNPEWGAEPGKLYFVIKHGEKL